MQTYLYNRVSSTKQSKTNKDGLTRQSESPEVKEFIERHGLTVVKKMVYIGSSYKGRNFDNTTALGKFIEKVKQGTIPTPVCLCFENWDRFGRDTEWKNTKRFLDLIDSNVSIGVVGMDIIIDQEVLEKNSNILQLVVNDIQRSRKESERKSGFAIRNISRKVQLAKQGEKIYFGGQTPRWITGVKNNEFVLDNEMVKTIEYIFDLYLKGNSCIGIAKILNGEKTIETFGPSRKSPTTKTSRFFWFNTTIKNILTHKSLTGWCKVKDFESSDYYPEIISPGVFLKVQQRVKINSTKRGGNSVGNVPNLFRGIVHCGKCGNDIGVRWARVKNQNYCYMACRKSQVNICNDKTIWKMNELEERFFAFVLQSTPDEILTTNTMPENQAIISRLKLDLQTTNDAISRNVQLLEGLPDMTELKTKLEELNDRKKTLIKELASEESKGAAISANPSSVKRFKELFKGTNLSALDAASDSIHDRLLDHKVREELRNIMPDIISKITCHLSEWEYDVEFVNGTVKHFDFYL